MNPIISGTTQDDLISIGFTNIGTVDDLMIGKWPTADWMQSCGVYSITVSPKFRVEFLSPSETRANQNVISPWSQARLAYKWVNSVEVIYFGLAGRFTRRSLRERLGDLIKHASGKTTDRGPHRGGEIIWQLSDFGSFLISALPTGDPPEPRQLEIELLEVFWRTTGCLPFGNRQK